MEGVLISLAIFITISLLTALHCLNNSFSQLKSSKTIFVLNGNALHLMNVTGKWLILAGGLAVFPLMVILLFAPESASSTAPWISPLAILGCITLFIATIVLLITFISECLTHKLNIKRIGYNFYQFPVIRLFKQYGLKAVGWFTGAIVLAFFIPFLFNMLIALATVTGFLVIIYFWLLDDSVEEEYIDSGAPSLGGSYNYATGKVDSGYEYGGIYEDD